MRRVLNLVLSLIVIFSSGCFTEEPGETTGMGAAAGGVMGAGLGALIGSQTGSAGTGLLVGAVAGSASGAVVGNMLEAEEQAVDAQDQVLAQRDRQIAEQGQEIEQLRVMNDSVQFRGDAPPANSFAMNTTGQNSLIGPSGVGLQEKTIISSSSTAVAPQLPVQQNFPPQETTTMAAAPSPVVAGSTQGAMGAYNWGDSGQPQASANSPAALATQDMSPECRQAAKEVGLITPNMETADKLFHYRRALRLCPTNAAYHNGLGEIYLSLGRKADAEYEFREALNLDPGSRTAQRNLSSIEMQQ